MTDTEAYQLDLLIRFWHVRSVMPSILHFPAVGESQQKIYLVSYTPGGIEKERLEWERFESLIEIAEDLLAPARIQPGKEVRSEERARMGA